MVLVLRLRSTDPVHAWDLIVALIAAGGLFLLWGWIPLGLWRVVQWRHAIHLAEMSVYDHGSHRTPSHPGPFAPVPRPAPGTVPAQSADEAPAAPSPPSTYAFLRPPPTT